MFPAKWYNHYGDDIPGSRGYATFFSFYFMMTGLHGIHIRGRHRILLSWLYVKAGKDALYQLLLHARRHGGPVLAHRRHDLDLSVPVVLLDFMSTHNDTHATHAERTNTTTRRFI